MKRLFLSLVILLSFSFTLVNAQEGRREGRRGFALPQELNLSNEQQQKVESVNADFKAKMTELRSKSDLTKEDKRAKMKELRKEHRDAINNILTPEQQEKMKELKAKREKAMSMRGNKKQGKQMDMRAHHRNRMKDLNLTEEQKQKINVLNENYKAKTKELAQQHRDDLNKIYTPEQQAKMKDLRKDFSKNHKFAHGGKERMKLDDASVAKLKNLKENYDKEKKAIELSRIAPDAQKQKLSDLRQNFKKEKRQIIKEAHKVQDNKPV